MRSVKTVQCRTQEWDFCYNPYSVPIVSKVFEKEVFRQVYSYLTDILFFQNTNRVFALSIQFYPHLHTFVLIFFIIWTKVK